MKKIGFTIGKFAPLHKGHQYLIEKGLQEMDEFVIVLYETNKFNIELETRAKWIKTLYPEVTIIFAENPPEQYGLDEISVNIQMKYLSRIIENVYPTHFYSSEPYGEYVAKYLHIENVQVDKARKNHPISSTKIRENLEEHKSWINPIVYEDCKNLIRR